MIPSGAARVAGVMGWPVRHSRSPRVHGYWLEHYGIDGAYVPFAVQPTDLATALAALPRLALAGVNLTVPHKEAAVALVDEVSAVARRIGAVNTVVVRGRTLVGDNTDAMGFRANLREQAPTWTPNAPAVVLGAGGAARAVAVALVDEGVPEIRIVNRTPARAHALVSTLGAPLEAWPWSRREHALADAGLLVNTTTLGMAGGPALALSLAHAPPTLIVCDIVYTPLETPLLAAARARGLAAVDGLGMLLHQARPGFAAWFGVEPAVTPALRAFVMADLKRG